MSTLIFLLTITACFTAAYIVTVEWLKIRQRWAQVVLTLLLAGLGTVIIIWYLFVETRN